MKKYVFSLIITLLVSNMFAVAAQKTETRPEEGSQVIFQDVGLQEKPVLPTTILSRDDRLELLWQTSDPTAISGKLAVSQTTGQSFVGWYLNSERASLYQDNPTPVWEHTVSNADFDYPVIMTEDGSVLALADGSTLKVFDPSSSTPIWEFVVGGAIIGIALNTDGTVLFLGIYDSGQDRALVESYNIGNPISNWSTSFDGGVGNLVISGDGSTLILTQYGGISAMWVLDADNGSIIFEATEYNQNPPAMSYDATYILNGDCINMILTWKLTKKNGTIMWLVEVVLSGSEEWLFQLMVVL